MIQRPLTEIEKAELVAACQQVLTAAGMLLLRRALFELDVLRAAVVVSGHSEPEKP